MILNDYFSDGEIPEREKWEEIIENLNDIKHKQKEELEGLVNATVERNECYYLKYPKKLGPVFEKKGWEVREFYKCVGNGDCPHKGVLPRASNNKISEWRSDHARRCIIKIGTDRYAYQYWECCGHTCNSWCKGEKVAVIEL